MQGVIRIDSHKKCQTIGLNIMLIKIAADVLIIRTLIHSLLSLKRGKRGYENPHETHPDPGHET